MSSASRAGWLLATGLVLGALYWVVIPPLVRQWADDDDYTHGSLILPLALYFVWERGEALKRVEPRPNLLGAGALLGRLPDGRGSRAEHGREALALAVS
jgi:hypothetical protein